DIVDGTDTILASLTRSGPLEAGAFYDAAADVQLPLGASGAYRLIVLTNATNTISERFTNNNQAAASTSVTLSPFADLATSAVTAPTQVIGDPGRLDVAWTVTNQGTGAGITSQWTDRVVASGDTILGNGDDIVLGEFVHTGALLAGASYTSSQQILLPAGLTGRFQKLFVVADAKGEVFENSSEANNAAAAANLVDIMPIPYADLVVTTLASTGTPQSGQPLHVDWTVENQGIGVTNTESWVDTVTLATDAAGNQTAFTLGSFSHIGKIAAGLSYQRSVDVVIPNGVSGSFFLVVKTGGPFEFVFNNNNQRVIGPINVQLSASPDLAVTNIVAPANALEGDPIDISWTVANNGQANAAGAWTDIVYLKRIDIPNGPVTTLGQFTYDRGLTPGTTYTRTERFTLPAKIQGTYQVVVATNTG